MSAKRMLLLGAAVLLAAGGAYASGSGALAQEPAQISLRVPEEKVEHDVDEFIVAVEITGAQNLGAFLFVMTYDSDVATVKDVRQGPFLGSSGREVNCDPPVLQEGQIRYFCVTLRPTPEGADGAGVLAEVVLEPKDGGTTQLEITRVQITDPTGAELDVSASGGVVEVEKPSSFPLLWLIVIGVAGGVVLLVLFEVARRWIKSRRSPATEAV